MRATCSSYLGRFVAEVQVFACLQLDEPVVYHLLAILLCCVHWILLVLVVYQQWVAVVQQQLPHMQHTGRCCQVKRRVPLVVCGVHLAVVAVAGVGGCCVQWPGGWVVPEAVAAAWWWWWS